MRDPQIGQRLDQLPYGIRNEVRAAVLKRSGASSTTIYYVMTGKSQNLPVLKAFSEVLGCTINDLLEPSYKFNLDSIQLTPHQ